MLSKAFIAQSRRVFLHENALFLADSRPPRSLSKIRALFDTYIKPNSRLEIDLPIKMRDRALEMAKDGRAYEDRDVSAWQSLIDECVNEINELIKDNWRATHNFNF